MRKGLAQQEDKYLALGKRNALPAYLVPFLKMQSNLGFLSLSTSVTVAASDSGTYRRVSKMVFLVYWYSYGGG